VAWCEATLGVVPGPGGEHPLFGTHNRLLRLSCAQATSAYLEIIAVNPLATPTRPAPLKRWFDLDDAALQTRLAQQGPQLVHWVASVPVIDAATRQLSALGIERGLVIGASRPTAAGLLQWRITVRDDGQRLFDGALPTLIQWGDTHPADTMPDSGLTLQRTGQRHAFAATLVGGGEYKVEPRVFGDERAEFTSGVSTRAKDANRYLMHAECILLHDPEVKPSGRARPCRGQSA
jgi:hypothetical protein